MRPHYTDIIMLAGPPTWYDQHGAPRYGKPSALDVDVYARYVALIRIRCQDCEQEFTVASVWSYASYSQMGNDPTFPTPSDIGSFHYGDPPRHACRNGHGAGETMTSIPVQVLEFWDFTDPLKRRRRRPVYEFAIDEEWAHA